MADEESDEIFSAADRWQGGDAKFTLTVCAAARLNCRRTACSRPPPGTGAGGGKSGRLRQEQLPLEVISKGRFEKGEPTVLDGQDLDVPTYVRRGAALN